MSQHRHARDASLASPHVWTHVARAALAAGTVAVVVGTLACSSSGAPGAGAPADAGPGANASEAGPGANASDAGPGANASDAAVADATSGAFATAIEACGALYDALAQLDTRCQTYPGIEYSARDRYALSCALAAIAPGVADGVSRTVACQALVDQSLPTCAPIDWDTQCKAHGVRPLGAACAFGTQCESGVCHAPIVPGQLGCGVCAARGAVGEPCVSGGDDCAAGLFCTFADGTSLTCAIAPPESDLGGSCVAPSICKLGLRCASGACAPLSDVGGACASHDDCRAPNRCVKGACAAPSAAGAPCPTYSECGADLDCEVSNAPTCRPRTFGAPGASCNEGRDGTYCRVGLCNETAAAPGTCPSVLGDGQPCDATSTTTTCDLGAGCTNGTCQVLDPSRCG